MKQQFLGIILFVSLGVAGVALSQPGVISFGAAMLGIRMSSETVEPSAADEWDTFETYAAPLHDDFLPAKEIETSIPVYPAYPNYPIEPIYEVVAVEPEPVADFDADFVFADLSVPLTAEITTATATMATVIPVDFDEREEDFAAFGQNLTFFEPQHSEPLFSEEPEEIVLYEPQISLGMDLPEQKPAEEFVRTRGRPIAAPSSHSPVSVASANIAPPINADVGGHSRLQVEANLVEIVPLPGAETVARVGTEYILGGDILPEVKKIAYFEIQESFKKMPPEERQKVTEQNLREWQEAIIQQVFPMILEHYVRNTLLYCDFASGRKKEEIQMWEKRLGDSFEEHELPKLMKLFEAENRMELNNTLERLIGSSIEREKAFSVRRTIGQIMISQTIKDAEGECTHEEMLNYYNDHKADFFHRARARWLQLTVNITPSLPREQAKEKIVWMGNNVAGGIPFEQVARDHSDGLAARNGGFNDWVTKGALVSDALEQVVFQGPIGALSPMIEDRNAFHIVRVIEREEEYYTPFLQAQLEIKKKIKELRRNKKEAEYFVELFRRFQPETYQSNVTSFSKPASKTAMPQGTGTSLHAK